MPTRARQRKQAELANASMSSNIYTAHCVLKTNKEIKICPANMQPFTKQLKLVWCVKDLPLFPISIGYNSAQSLRPFCVFRTCMRRPGCFPGAWSSCIFAIRQFAPKIVDLSCSHNSYFVYILLLLSKRSGEIQPLQLYVKKRGGKSGYAIIFLRWAESVRPLYASGSASMSWG